MNDPQKQEDGIKADIHALDKLKKINKSQEFNDYFDLILKTAADKMIWSFTGENVKTWEDFLKVRGEIVAYLYPIQEVRGADAMQKYLLEQLQNFYGKGQ